MGAQMGVSSGAASRPDEDFAVAPTLHKFSCSPLGDDLQSSLN
jgi:hypothetical protein